MAKGRMSKVRNRDLISLDAAAERLGLSPSFLRWALEGGLLQGTKDRQGEWHLPATELEAGLNAFQEEMALHRERHTQQQSGDQESARSPDAGVEPVEPVATEPDGPHPSKASTELKAVRKEPAVESGSPTRPEARPVADDWDPQIGFLKNLIDQQAEAIMAKDALIGDLARQIGKLGEAALARLADSDPRLKD